MKKSYLKKGLTLLLISSLSLSLMLFTGCGLKSANPGESTNTSAQQNASEGASNTSETGVNMADTLKTSMSELVTTGTITQDQADTIIEALSTPPDAKQQQKGQQPPQNDNGQKSSQKPDQQSSKKADEKGNNPKAAILSKLVSDGTITQKQADAVLAKLNTKTE